jgi:hypothetical protein
MASAALTLAACGLTLPTPVRNGALEQRARAYFSLGNTVVQQLGPTNPEDLEAALDPRFEFVAPLVGPLSKEAIISATTGLDLGQSMPDFDARYHDFRQDPDDPNRVWATMRVRGTQTGVLSFAGQDALPTSPPRRVESPPEAVSLRFTDAGLLRELTTGYPMDKRCGTTGGLGGLFGILEGLGKPLPTPLTRSTYEILTPVWRLLGSAPPPPSPALAQPPTLTEADRLPEARLLELTARLIETKFGAEDPSVLAPSFTFSGPVGAPLDRDAFLAAGWLDLDAAMPDLDYRYRDARVCDYDVNRVWYTSAPVGTHTAPLTMGAVTHAPTGKRWEAAPECGSACFDADGLCIGVTAGYVMDRRQGNTDGLGGIYGLCSALGLPMPIPKWQLLTPVQNLARLRGER